MTDKGKPEMMAWYEQDSYGQRGINHFAIYTDDWFKFVTTLYSWNVFYNAPTFVYITRFADSGLRITDEKFREELEHSFAVHMKYQQSSGVWKHRILVADDTIQSRTAIFKTLTRGVGIKDFIRASTDMEELH